MHYRRILQSDPEGTIVPLGGTEYHFKPLWKNGPDLAKVEDEQHQLVFDRIPEGYARYKGPFPEGFDGAPAELVKLSANSIIPETGVIATAAPSIEDLERMLAEARAKQAAEAPQAPAEPEKAPEQPQQADQPAPTGDDLAAFEGRDLTDEEDAALRAIFAEELQRKPSAAAKPATLIAQIRAKREAKG